jgi:hypothetical protein
MPSIITSNNTNPPTGSSIGTGTNALTNFTSIDYDPNGVLLGTKNDKAFNTAISEYYVCMGGTVWAPMSFVVVV